MDVAFFQALPEEPEPVLGTVFFAVDQRFERFGEVEAPVLVLGHLESLVAILNCCGDQVDESVLSAVELSLLAHDSEEISPVLHVRGDVTEELLTHLTHPVLVPISNEFRVGEIQKLSSIHLTLRSYCPGPVPGSSEISLGYI